MPSPIRTGRLDLNSEINHPTGSPIAQNKTKNPKAFIFFQLGSLGAQRRLRLGFRFFRTARNFFR